MTTTPLATVSLANGVAMPMVAIGCAFGDWVGKQEFQGFLPEQAWPALTQALDVGYRSFDGAFAYGTERIRGSLLGQRFATGELQRDDVFITTKLAHPATPPHVNISSLRTWDADKVDDIAQRVSDDYMRCLDDLGMGYTDLLLMHWPGVFDLQDARFARQARAIIWRTFVAIYEKKGTRAIGVANFSQAHLQTMMEDVPDVKPMVNQIEVHPYCRDAALEAYCAEQGIVISAYAPFGSGAFGLLQDPVISGIAADVGKSVGQVILRWHIQQGRTVLPKSSNRDRLAQNLSLFDFDLTDEHMAAIDGLGNSEAQRTCPAPDAIL